MGVRDARGDFGVVLLWTPLAPLVHYPAFSPLPQGWGAVLTVTYLLQAAVSLSLDHRFERGTFG